MKLLRCRKMVCRGVIFIAAFIALIAPCVSAADDIDYDTYCTQVIDCSFYDPSDPGCAANLPVGTLPKVIPEPYNGAFTNGANRFKVAPALIAALFTEENFTKTPLSNISDRWTNFVKIHPDPNSGWPTNKYQTMGAFQFIPPTWYGQNGPFDPSAPFDDKKLSDGYGTDGNGDGKRDPQNIADAAAGAAKYVASNGATTNNPPAAWHDAILNYNPAEWYVDAVMMYYNYYNTGATDTNQSTQAPPTPIESGCGTGSVNCQGSTPIAANLSAVRGKIVCIAQSELSLWNSGALKPGGSSGYFKYSQGRDENWCADFASWVYNQAGYPLSNSKDGNVPAVSSIMLIGISGPFTGNKFHWHERESNYAPRPGDLVIHKDGESHVNIVVAVNGPKVTIIGGNQASNDNNSSRVTQYDSTNPVSDGVTGYVTPD